MAAPNTPSSPSSHNNLNERVLRQTAWFLQLYQREGAYKADDQFLRKLISESSHDLRSFTTPMVYLKVPDALRRDTREMTFSFKTYVDILYLLQPELHEENEQANRLYEPTQIERLLFLSTKSNAAKLLTSGQLHIVSAEEQQSAHSSEEDAASEEDKQVQEQVKKKVVEKKKKDEDEKKEEEEKKETKEETKEKEEQKEKTIPAEPPVPEKKIIQLPMWQEPARTEKKIIPLPMWQGPQAPKVPTPPPPPPAAVPLPAKEEVVAPPTSSLPKVRVPYQLKKIGKDLLSFTAREVHHKLLTNKPAAASVLGGAFGFLAFLPNGLGSGLAGMAAGAITPVLIRAISRRPSEPTPEQLAAMQEAEALDEDEEEEVEDDTDEEDFDEPDEDYTPQNTPQRPQQQEHRPGLLQNPLLNQAGKRLANRLLKRGVQQVGTRAATAAAGAATSEIWVTVGAIILVIIIVIFFIILLMFLFMELEKSSALVPAERPADLVTIKDRIKKDAGGKEVPVAGNLLKVSKTGPESVDKYSVGDKISYTISATYTGTGSGSAEVRDTLPENVKYLDSNPKGEVSGQVVSWKLNGLTSNSTQTISLEAEITKDLANTWVVNNLSGSASASLPAPGGGTDGPGSGGGSCPSQDAIAANKTSIYTCKYLGFTEQVFDVGDTNISQETIEAYIQKYSPYFVGKRYDPGLTKIGTEEEFRRRVNYMVQKAKDGGINPLILFGYWRSESGFGTAGNRQQHGCLRPWVQTFETSVNCAAGFYQDGQEPGGSASARCASRTVSPEVKNAACKLLSDIRKAHPDKYANDPVSFPIKSYDDYAETYGPRTPNLGDAAVNRNCTHTYNTVIEVISSVNGCRPAGNNSATASTPGGTTNNGQLTNSGTPTQCSGEVISLGYTKKLLPLPAENNCRATSTGACGRAGTCTKPAKIIVHTTASDDDAIKTYEYFAGGSGFGGARRGVGTHFVIGKDGTVIQMVDLLKDTVEIAYGVANYSDHISIELVNKNIYQSKSEVPGAQYDALLKLVKQLMSQYSLPVGDLQFDWKSGSDAYNAQAKPGVYGHYQLNPQNKVDPGAGLMRDLRKELQ